MWMRSLILCETPARASGYLLLTTSVEDLILNTVAVNFISEVSEVTT